MIAGITTAAICQTPITKRFQPRREKPDEVFMRPIAPTADSNIRAASAQRLRELRGILEASFDAIPEIYRSVFLLREVEALSATEAAESLGISEDTVKTRLHRGRAAAPGAVRASGLDGSRALPLAPLPVRPGRCGGFRSAEPAASPVAPLCLPGRVLPRRSAGDEEERRVTPDPALACCPVCKLAFRLERIRLHACLICSG